MRGMQNGIAAIRGARVRTRFILPGTRRREPRLGLDRPSHTRLTAPPRPALAQRRSGVRALRARAGIVALPVRPPRPARLRRGSTVTWSARDSRAARSQAPGAAPWRG